MKKLFVLVFVLVMFASQAFGFNGTVQWQFRGDATITSGVAVSENILLFGDVTGKFYALNKNTGSVIWTKIGTHYTVCGTPSVTSNGNVIFAQEDGTITCLKISDGSKVWIYGNRDENNSNEALSDGVASGGEKIFAAKSDAKLYAHDENSGKVLWTFAAGEQGLRTAPAYSDGLVFLGEYDGLFDIIDASNGKRLNGGGSGGAINTPVIKNGVVYFSSWDGSVNAVKIKAVIPLWNVNVGDPITTSLTLSDEIAVVGTGRGNIVALNIKDGSIMWKYETQSGEISANPLIGDGVVVAGASQGNVFVFDAKTGGARHTIKGLNGMSTNGVYSEGTFYFVSSGEVCAVK